MHDPGVGHPSGDRSVGRAVRQGRAGAGPRPRPARRASGRGVFAAIVLVAGVWWPVCAQGQIWVVREADGGRRFTTQPEPGAELFLPTPHSRRAAGGLRRTSGRYDAVIAAAAARHRLDPALLRAVIATESNFDPRARSARGAQGLMQLMPETARELGVPDVWDPHANVEGGAAYLAALLRRYGDLRLALAAYNAGPGAVDRHGGVPPFEETRQYVERVLKHYENLR